MREDIVLSVSVTEESGYEATIQGLAFNKKKTPLEMVKVAERLADKDGGHNKYLEAIQLWIIVRAPRYWWQEADTYRIGCTKQSESTMHTLVKELQTIVNSNNGTSESAFKKKKESISEYIRLNFEPDSITKAQFEAMLNCVRSEEPDLVQLKKKMPEGFLQQRMWCMNYKCLRNIILQRRHHRLPHWHKFIQTVLAQVKHPELLPKFREDDNAAKDEQKEKDD